MYVSSLIVFNYLLFIYYFISLYYLSGELQKRLAAYFFYPHLLWLLVAAHQKIFGKLRKSILLTFEIEIEEVRKTSILF